MRRLTLIAVLAASAALLLTACGGGEADPASSPAPAGTEPTTTSDSQGSGSGKADPRDDGFEIALGEWALTAEAESIRPGRTTFVITNRGAVPHGFEIEREDVEDDGSKVETRFLDPGESVEVELDLAEGVYKLECNVEGHDDMGMEMLLEVRKDAPLAKAKKAEAKAKAASGVAIEGFAFSPATVEVAVGQEVTWENHDPAEHTVTQEGDNGFDSGTMAQGAAFKTTFDAPGEYRYICALHPGMKGTVVVTG